MNIFKFYKNFGFNFTNKLIINKILIKVTKKQKYREKNFKLILNYLNKNYATYLINDCNNLMSLKDFNYKVWIFWGQGIDENTPIIVRKCVDSIKRNFLDHEVIIVDFKNYKDYVDIPDYIIEKLNQKIISITHFSDILRACLLSKWGGIWLDATCYLTGSIEKEIENFAFYSNKLEDNTKFYDHVDKANWSAFFLASCANNPIMLNLRNLFYEYWKTHTCMINYFLVDYFIKLSYDKFNELKEMIDKVPANNPKIHELFPLLLESYDEKVFKNLSKTTKIFKLSYKINFNQAKQNSFYNTLN